MTKLVTVGLLGLSFAALSFGQVVVENALPSPDTLITLQRGGCEAGCAVYRLVIFADGTVVYEGRHFVRRTGLIKSGVSPEALNKLIGLLEAGGFFQMENNYGYGNDSGCQSIVPGRPTAILSVATSGRSKTVLHHHRCVGPIPDRLTDLEDSVDKAVGTIKWIK